MTHQAQAAGKLEQRIHQAEKNLFAAVGADVDEDFLELAQTGLRVRVLSHGSGPPVVLLHGVSLSAAAWAPLFSKLPHLRLLAVDLPGHGVSDPIVYRRGQVREHARRFIDDVIDALGLDEVPMIGHSLGGMFALWHMAEGSERISRMVAIGEPAVALPGVRVRMPLSMLTVRGLGITVLRSPSPRPVYRRVLAQGIGHAELAATPDSLVDALRLSARRPENARTVASLMNAIDRFRRPRPESILTSPELAAIRTPTLFILGSDDPYLAVERARPSIEQIPGAELHQVPGGHAPWLVDPELAATLIATHHCLHASDGITCLAQDVQPQTAASSRPSPPGMKNTLPTGNDELVTPGDRRDR
jgi:pimeloyl-ACP methyl ester carboxylesterase